MALDTRLKFVFPRPRTGAGLLYTLVAVLFAALAVGAAVRWSEAVAPARSTPTGEANFPQARFSDQSSIRTSGRRDARLSLADGRDLLTSYRGPDALRQALERNEAQPRSLASADFDEDGVPDLVSGYALDGRGIITIHRGNVDSIYPNAPEAKQRKAEGTFTAAPFLSPALALSVAAPPDFLGAGDFDADGHWDIVLASRGGTTLRFRAGDGRGNFGPEEEIALNGGVTAFATGEVNRRDGLTDIVIGIDGSDGPAICVFEGAEGALRAGPEHFDLPATATSLALGQFDKHYAFDLAVAAGNELVLVQGRDRKLSLDERQRATVLPASRNSRSFDFKIRSIAAGNFGGGPAEDLVLLADDGRVHFLNQTQSPPDEQDSARPLSQWQLEASGDLWPNATQLLRAQVSTAAWDDLIVVDASTRKLHALSRLAGRKPQAPSGFSPTVSAPRVTSFDVEGEPLAVLPMRLDVDALSDLVMLKTGSSAPTIMQTSSRSAQVPPDVNPEGSGVFSNPAPIAINASGPFAVGGTPYPSTITVAGFTGSLSKVRIRLDNVTKTFANDTDFLVVGPGGQKVLVLSHYFAHLSNVNLTFDDAADASITAPACCVISGTYKPTVTNPPPSALPAPAPAGPYGSALSVFAGADPNGTWSLYVANNNSITGTVAGGWEVILNDPPPTTFIVTNTNDSGTGSLRQAILDANQKVGPDIITFNIQPGGVQTIVPASALPDVTDVVTIDGTTQPGFVGVPLIEIDGTNTGGFAGTFRGVLNLKAGNSVVRGLVINRYNTDAIALLTLGNNIVEGNYIGTDLTGTLDRGNFADGIAIDSPQNLIGGTTAAARNLVSGLAEAVVLAGPGQNLVQGNYIGTNAAGDAQIANSHSGVTTRSVPGSANNVVGGTTAGARNLISAGISATGVDFVYAGSNGALVQGNYIGTDVTGTKPFGPFAGTFTGNNDGVDITGGAHDITIGGTTPAARNIISGNFIGVEVVEDTTVANLIQGNFVGTDVSGTAAIANSKGIFFLFDATANTIGGGTPAARNIISGNTQHGIHFGEPFKGGALNNVVQQNFIGTDVTGDAPIPNGRTPFFVDNDAGIVIPANSRGDKIIQNRIAYNKGAGIRITNVSGTDINSIEIEIADNLIYANEGLGIDLGPSGITANDPQDIDEGANRLQNFPVLTSATAVAPRDSGRPSGDNPDVTVTVNGTLNSAPSMTFTVNWYFSAGTQCVTNQETTRPLVFGKVPNVTTNASGNAQFSFPLDLPVGINSGIVNCTAIDLQGNTSEFSACLPVSSGPPPTNTLTVASSNPGSGVSITVAPNDNNAAGNGSTQFTRTYNSNQVVSLTAPASASSNNFQKWLKDGADFANNTLTNVSVTMDANHAMTAVYLSPTRTLTIASTNPASGVAIAVSPNDNNAAGNGTTQFTRVYNNTQSVNLTAPATASGNNFQKWLKDGADFTNNALTNVSLTMDANHTMTAVYVASKTIQFSSATYAISETGPRVDVTVTRSGDTTSVAAVNYVTNDGAGLTNCDVINHIASPRCDYTNTGGTLQWAAGDATAKSFSIAIVDDGYAEGNETFTASLNSPSGATLGAQSTATVTITDNEATNGTNPIDNTNFFVRQQYIDFLGREPDPPGFAGWTSTINNCSGDTTQCDRIHVSQLFFQSEEFQSRGYFVYRFYPVAFGRKPDYGEFIPDLARVSGFLDANQLEAAKVQFITDFMARAAFVSTYNSLNNTQYVDTLLNTAGVTSSSRQTMIDGLNNATKTRGAVLRQIVESPEVAAKYNHQAYAVLEYFGYLRRQPDGGYLAWIAVLDGSNDPRGMVTGFVNSIEYRNRFGP